MKLSYEQANALAIEPVTYRKKGTFACWVRVSQPSSPRIEPIADNQLPETPKPPALIRRER
jgi:hypothetical protein